MGNYKAWEGEARTPLLTECPRRESSTIWIRLNTLRSSLLKLLGKIHYNLDSRIVKASMCV